MRSLLFIVACGLIAYYLIRRYKEQNSSVVKDFQMRRDLAAIGNMKSDVWQKAEIPFAMRGEAPLTDIDLNPWWDNSITAQPRDAQYLPRVFENPNTINLPAAKALYLN